MGFRLAPLTYPFQRREVTVARQPKLRKKKIGPTTYWFTKAGGETYFGNVQDVSYDDARRAIREHMNNLNEPARCRKGKGPTAGELMDLYLDWLEKNRSTANFKNRRTHLNRFGGFCPPGGMRPSPTCRRPA
jgi:hypothetical protein